MQGTTWWRLGQRSSRGHVVEAGPACPGRLRAAAPRLHGSRADETDRDRPPASTQLELMSSKSRIPLLGGLTLRVLALPLLSEALLAMRWLHDVYRSQPQLQLQGPQPTSCPRIFQPKDSTVSQIGAHSTYMSVPGWIIVAESIVSALAGRETDVPRRAAAVPCVRVFWRLQLVLTTLPNRSRWCSQHGILQITMCTRVWVHTEWIYGCRPGVIAEYQDATCTVAVRRELEACVAHLSVCSSGSDVPDSHEVQSRAQYQNSSVVGPPAQKTRSVGCHLQVSCARQDERTNQAAICQPAAPAWPALIRCTSSDERLHRTREPCGRREPRNHTETVG